MKNIATALVLAASAIAAPAMAQDVSAPSGPRAEAIVGYDRISLDLGDYGLGTYSKDGVAYGLAVGYDIPTAGSVSFGVDAEVTGSSTKVVFDDGTDRLEVKAGRDLYVGARVTAAVNPRLNLYAKVGYTNARISAEYNGEGLGGENGDGVRFGVGGQLAIMQRSYLSLEYRYSNYEGGFSRNQVLAGLGVRF
ncbi:outer membrane protein [Novosphingobium sp.]|uniref:outer membrane protein n=1 Tax=Novosphingobium sp. TaxID=1874826 RepID=UPI0038B704F2